MSNAPLKKATLRAYFIPFDGGEMEHRDLIYSDDRKYFTGEGQYGFCPWAPVSAFGTGSDWRVGIYSRTKAEAKAKFIRERIAEMDKARALLAKVGVVL